ncbi:hypothetical protein [Thiolapillus sp.]
MSTLSHFIGVTTDHLIVSGMLLALHEVSKETLPKGIMYWAIKIKMPPDIFYEVYQDYYANLQAETSIVMRWKMVIGMLFW